MTVSGSEPRWGEMLLPDCGQIKESAKKKNSPSLECCVGNYSRKGSFNYLGHEWTCVWILNFLIWQHTVFSPFHPKAEMCFVPISHNCENELYWLHLVNWFLLIEKGNIKDAMNSHIWIYQADVCSWRLYSIQS